MDVPNDEMIEWLHEKLWTTLRQFRPKKKDITMFTALIEHFEPARPMAGFVATLTPDQRRLALQYLGDDTVGNLLSSASPQSEEPR